MVRPLRAVCFAIAALAISIPSCGSGGAATRTVFVDYSSDQFEASFFKYFPNELWVHPGDAIVFRQSWTGEAHSVTLGTIANAYGKAVAPFMPKLLAQGYQALPQPEPKSISDFETKLPFMFQGFGPGIQKVAQNGAQPCYLDSGVPPKDPNTPCTKAQQRQPAFNGRQSFYNSGYIHYAAPSGNTFRMKIAADATPGRYFFFCNNHGPLMSGYITIKPKSARVPSQGEVNKTALREADQAISPVAAEYRRQQREGVEIPADSVAQARDLGAGPLVTTGGHVFYRGPFAGFAGLPEFPAADGLEFFPKHVTAHVGQKVTWVVGMPHTISFDVPSYFPIFTVEKNGTVVRNPRLDPPAGGSPPLPAPDKLGDLKIDAGTWDGTHFFSSGYLNPEGIASYSVRFAKAGTYKFACLIHPGMVGSITITR